MVLLKEKLNLPVALGKSISGIPISSWRPLNNASFVNSWEQQDQENPYALIR